MPFVNIDSRAIHFDCPRKLPSNVGHTVMLVHGAFDDRRIWRSVYEALASDHTPIGLDLPGHGSSDWPALESAGEYVNFMAALVESLGVRKIVVCGHSMGGSIAMHYTLEHASRVAGLIPVGSSPEWDLSEFDGGTEGTTDADPWADPDAAYAANLACLFSKQTSADLIAHYDRQIRQIPPRTCRADLKTCASFDLRARLSEITAPTCVICGDEEEWKDGSVAIHQHVRGASYHEIPAAGHAVTIEQPEAIVAVIKSFLASLP